jgi:hypothetical protein
MQVSWWRLDGPGYEVGVREVQATLTRPAYSSPLSFLQAGYSPVSMPEDGHSTNAKPIGQLRAVGAVAGVGSGTRIYSLLPRILTSTL